MIRFAWNDYQRGIYSSLFDLVWLSRAGWVFRWRPKKGWKP